MFASLDRVDIVLKEDSDGRKRFVQTDHRTTAELEREPELSSLMALVRILNPKRMAEPGSPEPLVVYSARERPPEPLRRVILAAGAQIVLGDDFKPDAAEKESPALDAVIQSTFTGLARAVAAEFQAPLTAEGLRKVEDALAGLAGSPETDEAAYWISVLKLGSFGGEVIRSTNGGQWLVSDSGTLPFTLSTRFRGEEARVNPLGKAIKRFANGEEDSLVSLVELLQSEP